MTTINKLSAIDTLAAGDQFVVYSQLNGDARRASGTTVKQFINAQNAARVRASMWPAVGSLAAILILLAIWPQEMGRMLARAVQPFPSLGNAGAFRFEVASRDLEFLERHPFEL